MKANSKFLISSLAISIFASILFSPNSQASLGGVEDYSNHRIVPMYNELTGDWVAYSAFLYSPRILFTVAHGEYYFDGNGNKINRSPSNTYAGLPNSKVSYNAPRVKVIKRFISNTYRFNNATLGDFAVFVLEKDLANVEPVPLLSPEIEAELVANNAEVRLHGYGGYKDICAEGQQVPCASNFSDRSPVPRMLTAKLYTLDQIGKIVGYERPQLKGSLTYFRAGKESLCGGDSGGSNTVIYKGKLLYLSVTGNGMNGYSCGFSSFFDGVGGILYTTPVYEHLDIIKEAEDFVAEQLKLEAAANPKPTVSASAAASNKVAKKITMTCFKGKSIKKVTAQSPKCPVGYKKKI